MENLVRRLGYQGQLSKEALVSLMASKVGASDADAQPAAMRPCPVTAAWQA